MLGHVEVNDTASFVREHDEDEQSPQGRGWHGEEVDREGSSARPEDELTLKRQ